MEHFIVCTWPLFLLGTGESLAANGTCAGMTKRGYRRFVAFLVVFWHRARREIDGRRTPSRSKVPKPYISIHRVDEEEDFFFGWKLHAHIWSSSVD